MSAYSDHKQKWKTCTRCPLHRTRNRVVLGKGSLPCDVLFIGESPGESEDDLGSPFKGRAGDLLDRIILEAVDLLIDGDDLRLKFAFTNVIGCIPLEDGDKRDPIKAEIQSCASRLVEFSQMASPIAIVCLGELSATWVPKLVDMPDVRLINLPHPSRILRIESPHAQKTLMKQTTVRLANLLSWVSEC